MSMTYSDYLKIDKLLSLQSPKSDPPEHDEALFIIIHQVYELWFKLLLHESDKVKEDLSGNRLFDAISTFQRMRTILKTLVSQLDILETMTPMSFASFRDRLEQASGFQSAQFRELEFVMGHKRAAMLAHHSGNPVALAALEKRLNEPSVVDAFYDFLEHQGVGIPEELRKRPIDMPARADSDVQQGILTMYRTKRDVTLLLELMTDFDEGFQEWRYRHVKMVERTIGNQRGTGGSLGVEFLRGTLFKSMFEDLWAIRHEL
jgi:tryptophan 2,3-dioxygenase